MRKDHKIEIVLTIVGTLGAVAFELLPDSRIKEGTAFAFLLSAFLIVLFRLPTLPKINERTEEIYKDLTEFVKELKNLVSDHKVNEVTNHINGLRTITKEIGIGVFNNYIKRFNLED